MRLDGLDRRWRTRFVRLILGPRGMRVSLVVAGRVYARNFIWDRARRKQP